MYQDFVSRHFSNQSGIIVLVNSPRTSPRNETVKQCRRQTTVANSPVQWSWTWCRTWWNHSWHSSRVTLNQHCFVFIRRALLWCIDIMSFRKPREPQRCFLVAPHRGEWSSIHCTVTCHQQPRPGAPPTDLRRLQRVLRHEKLWNYVTWPAWENSNVFLFNWCLYSSEISDCKSP